MPDQTQRALELWQQGYTMTNIAKQLGLTLPELNKAMPLKLRQTIQHVRQAREQQRRSQMLQEREALMAAGRTAEQAADTLGIPSRTLRQWQLEATQQAVEPAPADVDLIAHAVKTQKQIQRLQDMSRIERKAFREQARYDNALGDLTQALTETLESMAFTPQPPPARLPATGDNVGLVHWTDHHFNEYINIQGNRYDLEIAAKRLKLHVDKVRNWFLSRNVTKAVVMMTGDLLNSDRRLDEKLSQVTNRAKATIAAVEILQQALKDLRKDFTLDIAYVTGNESRAQQELGWTSPLVSDNYDTIIFHTLRLLFDKDPHTQFLLGDERELLFQVNGRTIGIAHGHSKGSKNPDQLVSDIRSRLAADGFSLDYLFLGHLHATYIGDFHCRGASLAGANAYSTGDLNLASRAAQTAAIIDNSGRLDVQRFDLQDVGDCIGYQVPEYLCSYNPLGDKIGIKTRTIHQVII